MRCGMFHETSRPQLCGLLPPGPQGPELRVAAQVCWFGTAADTDTDDGPMEDGDGSCLVKLQTAG